MPNKRKGYEAGKPGLNMRIAMAGRGEKLDAALSWQAFLNEFQSIHTGALSDHPLSSAAAKVGGNFLEKWEAETGTDRIVLEEHFESVQRSMLVVFAQMGKAAISGNGDFFRRFADAIDESRRQPIEDPVRFYMSARFCEDGLDLTESEYRREVEGFARSIGGCKEGIDKGWFHKVCKELGQSFNK